MQPPTFGANTNMKPMITRYATLLALLSAPCIQAQTITSVSHTPSTVIECDLITFTIHGQVAQQATLDSFNIHIVGNSYTIRFCVSGSGGPQIAFNQAINPMGPFSPGAYTFLFNLISNGVNVSNYTSAINVGVAVNPDPGTSTLDSICNSDPSFLLITHLGGSPDPGGVWTDPSNVVIPNGMFIPGTSPYGFYTYSFDVLPPCISSFSQVGIMYNPNSNAGSNGTVQVCAGPAPSIDLFTHLGGTPQAGGAWTKGGVAHSNIYVPGTDVPGVYTYTVAGIPPCGDPHATVTVAATAAPHAGADGAFTTCYNDTAILLNNHISGEANTGTWYDVDGFPIGAFGVHMSALLHPAGIFHYVVMGANCPNDTATLVLTYIAAPCNIGVLEISGNVARFELMPNPAHDQVMIEIELGHAAQSNTLEVLDVNGQVVRSEALLFNGTLLRRSLDVSALKQGAYIVRVTSSEGSAVRRLMLR